MKLFNKTPKKVYYIFNSAFNDLYKDNLLKTIFYQDGWINEYRYSYEGDSKNIRDEDLEKFLSAKKKEVVIVFVDRYNKGGYKYYPIRKAKLIRSYKKEQRIIFKVKLGKIIFPKDLDQFNKEIRTLDDYPKLTNNNPGTTNDGAYAIEGKNIIEDNKLISDNTWSMLVNHLKETEKYRSNDSQLILFSKIEFYKGNQLITPKIKNKEFCFYPIKKNNEYYFSHSYVYPSSTSGKITLSLKANQQILLDNSNLSLNSRSNTDQIKLTAKKYYEDEKGNVIFEFKKEGNNKTIYAPNTSIQLRIKESIWGIIALIFAILVFASANIVIGTDIPNIANPTFHDYYNSISFVKIVGAILQAGALFVIYKAFGKKIL
jgi:hypothetical protein